MAIDDADWRRLDAALSRCLGLPDGEREAELQRRLADRPDLLAAGLEALGAEAEQPSIESMAPALLVSMGTELDRREDEHWQARRLGPWEIGPRIAAGGMGSVYRGRRADGAFEREVAVKLLPLSLQDEDMVRRFERERAIAARLDHPGIARLLDGGTAEDGSPWLVLEYIDGQRIDAWCDARSLNLRARIELLLQVCEAVQFAHRNLVVHRDLKPANILVDAEGRVRLLDFGIARLLADIDPEGATAPLGARLTPDYAAPEQFTGEAVTAATDVYALGCLLYRLLAGRVPLSVSGLSLSGMLAASTEADRPALSSVARADEVPPGVKASQIDADLDAIAAVAVQPEAEQRYGAASDFAQDLRRWLDGLPVLARPVGRWRKALKFARRHRTGFGATAAAFLLLAVTAGAALYQADQARAQRDEAQAVSSMLQELMRLADPDVGLGHQVNAHSLLRGALERALDESAASAPTRIALLETVADALLAFELADEALRARREMHRLMLAGHGPDHPETLVAQRRLALAQRQQRGEFEATERLFTDVLERRRRVLGPDHADTAESLWDLGFLYLRFSDQAHPGRERAEDLIARALAIYREQLGADHPLTGRVLFDLGLATDDAGLKLERMQRGIAIQQASATPDDLQLLQHQGDLALVLGAAGRAEEAIAMARAAAEGYAAARGELHAVSIIMINNLAGLLRDFGRYEEALTTYRRVDELVRAVVPEGHLRRAFPLFGQGATLMALDRPAEAEAPLRQAIAVLQHNRRDNLEAVTRVELGDALAALGREAEAQAEYQLALSLWREKLGRAADDPQVAAVERRLTTGSSIAPLATP